MMKVFHKMNSKSWWDTSKILRQQVHLFVVWYKTKYLITFLLLFANYMCFSCCLGTILYKTFRSHLLTLFHIKNCHSHCIGDRTVDRLERWRSSHGEIKCMWTLLRPCVSVKLDHRSYTEDVSERQGVDKFPWQRSSIGTFSEVEIGFRTAKWRLDFRTRSYLQTLAICLFHDRKHFDDYV